jgi:hypothetical protein
MATIEICYQLFIAVNGQVVGRSTGNAASPRRTATNYWEPFAEPTCGKRLASVVFGDVAPK